MTKALIISPHPDDAEWAMGGTIVLMLKAGWDVTIVDLTDGEPTPNGSKSIRAAEAEKANQLLGNPKRINLDLPNRHLQATLESRKKIAEIIRLEHPDVLFGPALPDQHPDHVAAHTLTQEARFEGKLSKTTLAGTGHWTPSVYYYYSIHRQESITPSIIIDVSETWETKQMAVETYQSQTSSPSHSVCPLERIQTYGKYFGHCINRQYGEPFCKEGPIEANDVMFMNLSKPQGDYSSE